MFEPPCLLRNECDKPGRRCAVCQRLAVARGLIVARRCVILNSEWYGQNMLDAGKPKEEVDHARPI